MVSERVILAVEHERTSKSYAENYYEEEKEMAPLFAFDTQVLDEIINKPGLLFDAMMGRGRHVIHFAKKGFRVEGNDYNPHMVQLTRLACQGHGLSVKLHNKDVTHLKGIAPQLFEYVLCTANSFGCIPGSTNRSAAISEFARILKPGGLLALHVFNRYACFFDSEERSWLFSTYIKRDPKLELGDWLFYHGKELGMTFNHMFSLREVELLIRKAGLHIQEVRFINRSGNGYCKGLFKPLRAGSFLVIAKKD